MVRDVDLLVTERLPAHLEELELNSFAVLKDVEYVVYTAQYNIICRRGPWTILSASVNGDIKFIVYTRSELASFAHSF